MKSDRVPELERALAAAKERYAQHATDMADAQAQLAELKDGLTQLHAQNSTLSEQLDEKTRVAEAARREAVDAVKLAREGSHTALRDVDAARVTLEAEAELRNREHAAEVEQLTQEAETHKARAESSAQEAATALAQVAHLEGEVENLQQGEETLQAQVAHLEGELEALHDDAERAERLLLIRCAASKKRAVARALRYAEATVSAAVERLRRETPPSEVKLPESGMIAVLAAAEIDRPVLDFDGLFIEPRSREAPPINVPDVFARLNVAPLLENASVIVDPAVLADAARATDEVLRAALSAPTRAATRSSPHLDDDATLKVIEELRLAATALGDKYETRLHEVTSSRDAAVARTGELAAALSEERGLAAEATRASRRSRILSINKRRTTPRRCSSASTSCASTRTRRSSAACNSRPSKAATARDAHWERRWEVAAAEQAAKNGELVRRLHSSVKERNEAVAQVRDALRAARAAQQAVDEVSIGPSEDVAAELAKATSELADAKAAAVAASKAAARERDDGQKRLEAAEQRRVRELSKLEDEWRAKCAEQVKRAEGVGEERLERRMRQAQEDLEAARASSTEAIAAAHGRSDERLARERSMRLAAETELSEVERAKSDAERLLAKGLEDLEAVIQDRDARLLRASEASREAAADFEERLANGAAAAEAAESSLREDFEGRVAKLNEELASKTAAHARLQDVARTTEEQLRQVLDRDVTHRGTQSVEVHRIDRPAQTQIYGLEVVPDKPRRRKKDTSAVDRRFEDAAAARAAAEAKAALELRATEARFAEQLAALRSERDEVATLKAELATRTLQNQDEVEELQKRLSEATAEGQKVAALQEQLAEASTELKQAKADAVKRGEGLATTLKALEARLVETEESRSKLELQAEETQSQNEHLQLNLSVARRDAEARRQVHDKNLNDLQLSLRECRQELQGSLQAEKELRQTVAILEGEAEARKRLEAEVTELRSKAEADASSTGREMAELKRDLAQAQSELAVSSQVVPESPMVKRRLARLEGELAEALDGIETARDELNEAKRRFKKALDAAQAERDAMERDAEETVKKARATAEASVASARAEAADAVRLARGSAEQASRDVDAARVTRSTPRRRKGTRRTSGSSPRLLARATPRWRRRRLRPTRRRGSGRRSTRPRRSGPSTRRRRGACASRRARTGPAGAERRTTSRRSGAATRAPSSRGCDGSSRRRGRRRRPRPWRLRAELSELASPRSSDDEESPAVASLKRELEAARAALTDQRLRGDPAENDAVARLREALGRKDDQLEVLEDEVSRCRADVERRRGVEEELRRELLAKTSSTPPSGAKLLRTLAHGDEESPDLEDDADGDVEALERDLEEAQETISSLEAAADEAQRTIETLETAAAQDEAALEAYDGKLEAAQDDARPRSRMTIEAAQDGADARRRAAQDEIKRPRGAAEARQRAAALEDEIKAMRAVAETATLRGERDEARRSLDESHSLLGQARGAEAKAKDDLATLQKAHEDAVAAQATDSLRVGRLEAALEQHGSDLVEATANAARAEGALSRKADEVKRLETIIQQKEQNAVEASQRFDEILAKRTPDDRAAVERLQACIADRDAETARVLEKAKATEAHSLKLRETLAAAEANAAAYTAKYHLLEASTSAGSRARPGHRGAHDWSAAGVLPLLSVEFVTADTPSTRHLTCFSHAAQTAAVAALSKEREGPRGAAQST